jgi:phosphatidylinositol alpha-1,6-mannosyltransferase
VSVRALFVASETYAAGGIQRFNRTFLTACSALGVSCDVVSLADGADARERWTAPASVRIRVYGHQRIRFSLASASRIRHGRYDIVFVAHINLLRMVGHATRFQRVKPRIILIAHGIEVWDGLVGGRRRALRIVDSVFCVSHYTRQAIQAQAPELPDERFVIFPNALSETWRKNGGQPASTELTQRLPDKFLLAVSRLDRGERYKGIVTVIETLPMIDPSVHYVIAGHGNDMEFIEQVVSRCGVSSRVHFLGAVTDADLAALYRRCLAFVLPSGKEGFGIVFLEAMYFGACVIAAAEKGALDVVQNEATGLLVPYGDTVALKEAIARIVRDPVFRERLAAAGHETVVGEGPFTFRSYVTRLASLLNVPAPEPLRLSGTDSSTAPDADETCA